MTEDLPGDDSGLQRQIDELREHGARNRADIEALESRAEKADARADASESHAATSNGRADASDLRSDYTSQRLADLEARIDVNEGVLAELQADGLISHDHAVHLSDALRSSRMIGAAIGIVMATLKVSEVEAFAILSRASQNTNRKVRVLASEVVSSGDTSALPSA